MFIAGLVSWVAIALLVGFIASKLIDLHGDDPRLGIAVAGGGGIVAAFLYTVISGAAVSPWNFWTLLIAGCGALAGVVIWHAARSRFVSREPYTRRSSY